MDNKISTASKLFSCFAILLIIATALNFFKKGKQRHDQVLSGGSSSNALGSVEERSSVGKRKSLWEGGTKGARSGSGVLKSASKRGIATERANAEEAIGEATGEESSTRTGATPSRRFLLVMFEG